MSENRTKNDKTPQLTAKHGYTKSFGSVKFSNTETEPTFWLPQPTSATRRVAYQHSWAACQTPRMFPLPINPYQNQS